MIFRSVFLIILQNEKNYFLTLMEPEIQLHNYAAHFCIALRKTKLEAPQEVHFSAFPLYKLNFDDTATTTQHILLKWEYQNLLLSLTLL